MSDISMTLKPAGQDRVPSRSEAEMEVRRRVSEVEYNDRLGGWIGKLNGTAYSGGIDCVIGRGTVLVRQPDPRS